MVAGESGDREEGAALTSADRGTRTAPPDRLRDLLAAGGPVVCPGVEGGLAARLAAAHGFAAVYVSGAGTSAARGLPDMGLLGLSELCGEVHLVATASGLPVIVDADTGYGEGYALRRTMQELRAAGAAGVHIEDQRVPRRCGYLTSEPCVPVPEMLTRLEAARSADSGLVLIARTDALLTEGLSSAIDRAVAYGDAGVDLIMVNGITTLDELAQIAERVHAPLLYNVSGSDRSPDLDTETARRYGVAVVIYPIQAARAAAHAVNNFLSSLRGSAPSPDLMPFAEYMDLAGWTAALDYEASVIAKVDSPATDGPARR
jgi:2-methylisocitrate lyase-like PEP mutase family enzyme